MSFLYCHNLAQSVRICQSEIFVAFYYLKIAVTGVGNYEVNDIFSLKKII